MGIPRIRSAVVIAALFSAAMSIAQPSSAIKVVDPLTFTWRDTAQGPEPFVFQVFSDEGALAALKATVTNVKGPLGPADASSWRANTVPDTATPRSGAQVIVAPPALSAAGEYRVTVLLTASHKGGDVEEVRQLVVTRPAAQLAMDELHELTVRLTRATPWSDGAGTITAH